MKPCTKIRYLKFNKCEKARLASARANNDTKKTSSYF